MKASELLEVAKEASKEELDHVISTMTACAERGDVRATFDSMRDGTVMMLREKGYSVTYRHFERKGKWLVEFV